MNDGASGHTHTCCTWHHSLVKGINCSFQSHGERGQTQSTLAPELPARGNVLSRNCVVYTFGFTRKIRICALNVKHVSLPKLASAYPVLNGTLVEVWRTCAMTAAYPDTCEQSLQLYPWTPPQDWLGGRTYTPNKSLFEWT